MSEVDIDFYADALVDDYNTAIKRAMMECVILLETEAKRLCPVDTGRLRGSITGVVLEISEDIIDGRVGTNVEYAKKVELGTSMQSSQPYLRPALRNRFDEIVDIIQGAVR